MVIYFFNPRSDFGRYVLLYEVVPFELNVIPSSRCRYHTGRTDRLTVAELAELVLKVGRAK